MPEIGHEFRVPVGHSWIEKSMMSKNVAKESVKKFVTESAERDWAKWTRWEFRLTKAVMEAYSCSVSDRLVMKSMTKESCGDSGVEVGVENRGDCNDRLWVPGKWGSSYNKIGCVKACVSVWKLSRRCNVLINEKCPVTCESWAICKGAIPKQQGMQTVSLYISWLFSTQTRGKRTSTRFFELDLLENICSEHCTTSQKMYWWNSLHGARKAVLSLTLRNLWPQDLEQRVEPLRVHFPAHAPCLSLLSSWWFQTDRESQASKSLSG